MNRVELITDRNLWQPGRETSMENNFGVVGHCIIWGIGGNNICGANQTRQETKFVGV